MPVELRSGIEEVTEEKSYVETVQPRQRVSALRRAQTFAYALILLASSKVMANDLERHSTIVRDSVDVTEINHFYDENGRHVFDQLIYYDWSDEDERYHVRAWRLLKSLSQMPERDFEKGDYRSLWHDGEQLRAVRSKFVRESWSQHDPELVERAALPRENRREFSKLHKPTPPPPKKDDDEVPPPPRQHKEQPPAPGPKDHKHNVPL